MDVGLFTRNPIKYVGGELMRHKPQMRKPVAYIDESHLALGFQQYSIFRTATAPAIRRDSIRYKENYPLDFSEPTDIVIRPGFPEWGNPLKIKAAHIAHPTVLGPPTPGAPRAEVRIARPLIRHQNIAISPDLKYLRAE